MAMAQFSLLLAFLCLCALSTAIPYSRFLSKIHPQERILLEKFGVPPESQPTPDFASIFQGLKRSQDTFVPLVIIPSLVGNALDAKLQDSDPPHFFCSSTYDWYRIWLDTDELTPFVYDCWVHNLQLLYNASANKYSSPKGVTIAARGFGFVNTSSFYDVKQTVGVWNKIVDVFTDLGYVNGISIRSAPYDWRIGPDDDYYNAYFNDLRNLIEETYKINNNSKVAVTSLSMGGAVFNLFLANMTQEWKDKFIFAFIPLSSCFGGSAWAPLSFLGRSGFGDLNFSPLLSNWGAVAWLSPIQQLYASKVFLTTPTKQYRMSDLYTLFQDANLPDTAAIYKSILKFQIMTPPGVPTYCVYGTGLPTIDTVTFETDQWFGGASTNTTALGDGTCRQESLDFCALWAKQQKQPVETIQVPNMPHAGALTHPKVFETLLKLLVFN